MNLKEETNNTLKLIAKKIKEDNYKINNQVLNNNNEKMQLFTNFFEDRNQINNDKKSNKRKTVCLKSNTLNKLSLSNKEKNDPEKKTNTKYTKNYIENVIKEESIKEEKSEDEDEDDYNDKSEKNYNFISSKKENLVDNMVDNIFNDNKIISLKDEMLQVICSILNLLDAKDDKKLQSIKDAKEKISFYKSVDELNKKNKPKLIYGPRRRFTTVCNSTYMTSQPQMNRREFLKKGYFCITDWKTEEIGDKLTEVTKSLLNKIHPKEIYCGIFTKKDKEKTSPNVCFCIRSFNRLTSFVIEDILSYNSLKDKAKMFEKWVQVADYLKTKKNHNDCIAISMTLNNNGNLKEVRKELKTKTKNQLQQIGNFCTCLGNYSNIKEDMRQCEKTGEIFIPYLGLLLKEILTLNENQNYSKYINGTGCINMGKIEKTNTIIEKYYKFNKVKNNNNNQNIRELNFFYHLADIAEEELDKIEKKDELILDNKKITKIDKEFFLKYLK
jgi:hypothetical protein